MLSIKNTIMKKLLLTVLPVLLVILTSANTPDGRMVNEKAIQSFSKTYKGASGVEWGQLKEGGFVCRFMYDGKLERAYYDKRGNWLSTVAGYTGSRLPAEIRKMVRSVYYDHTILYAHEVVMAGSDPVYLVQVQDEKEIKILRISGGEMEVTAEMEK